MLRELLLDETGVDLRLADLARLCDMPAHRFGRAFRETFGATPHRWLIAGRVERARKLLEATHMPISEMAHVCGFADQSHLTRCFTRKFGISPAAFRRLRRS
jgi:transcriptional regulator GlxA family with amidase domain